MELRGDVIKRLWGAKILRMELRGNVRNEEGGNKRGC